MATIKDVAEIAGVSIATVSNYINRTKPVKQKTQDRISTAIEQLNYIPNYSAKNLKSNSYNDVGVIFPNFNDSYYVQIFHGIEKVFQGTNYFINLSFSNDIPDVETSLINNLLKKNVCGYILATCQPANHNLFYNNMIANNIPTVFLDREVNDLYTNFICFNNRETIRHLTSQLLVQGYKKIALIVGSQEYYCENECVQGYTEAFNNISLSINSELIYHINLNKEDAFRCTTMMLQNYIPEAIITSSETNAKGIIESLNLLRYSVPEDIIVISLGEEHWNQYTCSFSTIHSVRSAINMGETAAQLLLDQIKTPTTFESQRIILKDHLLTEDSLNFKRLQQNNKFETVAQKDEINILMLETPQVTAFQGLLAQFEKSTGIKVNLTKKPHHHLLKSIEVEHNPTATTHSNSDVYMFDIPWLYYLASNNILADISENIQKPKFDTEIFLTDSLKYFSKFKNGYYGLPFMYGPQILYYRKDLFEDKSLIREFRKEHNIQLRPPRTWAEFNAVAKFFTKSSNPISPVEYGTSITAAYAECMMPEIYTRLWSYNSNIYDRNNKVVFDNPQTLKTYSTFIETLQYAIPNYLDTDVVDAVYDFMNGKTAMLITYPSYLNEIIDLQKSNICGKIGCDIIPGRTPLLGGWSLGINNKSNKKSLAFEFIKWACGEKVANYFTLLEGQSAIKNVYQNDELIKLYPWMPLYYSVYEHTKPVVPPYQENKTVISQEKIEHIVCQWIYKIISNQLPIPKAIIETHKELIALFESYGYKQ